MIFRSAGTFSEILFLWRNFKQLRKAKCFPTVQIGEFIFRGFAHSDAKQVNRIYKELNNGAHLSFLRGILFCLLGKHLMLLASHRTESENTIIGMNMYYFNPRDINENTIHEGFIGVIPEAAGQGIATQMRKIAKAHFASLGIKGISTRISLNNVASLRSAEKLGSEPVEKYYDSHLNEERYYMVCKLGEK